MASFKLPIHTQFISLRSFSPTHFFLPTQIKSCRPAPSRRAALPSLSSGRFDCRAVAGQEVEGETARELFSAGAACSGLRHQRLLT